MNEAFCSANEAFCSANEAFCSVDEAFNSMNEAFCSMNEAFCSMNEELSFILETGIPKADEKNQIFAFDCGNVNGANSQQLQHSYY